MCVVALAIQLCALPAHAFDKPAGEDLDQPDVAAAPKQTEIFSPKVVETEVISAERVEALPAHDLADVAKNLTGVRVQRRVQGQAAAATVEGMPAEYTRVQVNGQQYSGEPGGVSDLSDVPVTGVEEIRLVRGPQAVRYGSDAGGAVFDVKTRRAPSADGYRISLDGGAGGDSQLYGSQSSGVRVGAFGATLSTTYHGIGGLADRGSDAVFVGTGEDGHEKFQDYYGTFDFDPSERFKLRANLGWRGDDDEIRNDGDSADSNGVRKTGRWLGSAGFESRLSESLVFETDLFRYATTLDSSIGREVRLRENEWKLDSALRGERRFLGFNAKLTLGVDWRVPQLSEREESDPNGVGGGEQTHQLSSAGIYAISETRLTDWATLELGARQQFNSKFDAKLVPQVAVLFEPFDPLRLRVSWGESYRVPTLRDLYQPPVPQIGGAYYLAGNPNLNTESAEGLRAGFEFMPRDWAALSGTFFYNSIDDFIRSAPDGTVVTGTRTVTHPPALPPSDPICVDFPTAADCNPTTSTEVDLSPLYRKMNLDRVRTRGVEVQLLLKPHPRAQFRASFGYLETYVNAPNLIGLHELPNEPHRTVDLEGTFSLPRTESQLTLRARWRDTALTEASGTGGVGFSTLQRSDPSWMVDMRLVQPLASGLELYVDLENLTNEDAVDSYEVRHFTVFAGLRFAFQADSHGGNP